MGGALCLALSRSGVRRIPDIDRHPRYPVSSARFILDVVRAVCGDGCFRSVDDDLVGISAPQPLVVLATADTQAALAAIRPAGHHRSATPGAEAIRVQRSGAIWTDAVHPSAMADRMDRRIDSGRADQW